MIDKMGAWGAATAWGATGMALLTFASWQFLRTPVPRAPDTLQAERLAAPAPQAAASSPAAPQPAAGPSPISPAPKASEAAAAPPTPDNAPRADIARVLPSGEVVVAGRTEPGGSVTLLDNGKSLMEMRADATTGEFVFLPPRLPAGEHNLSLRGGPAKGAKAPESAVMAFSIAPPAAKTAPVAMAAPAAQPAALEARIATPHEPVQSSIPRSNMATIARGDTLWRLSRERLGRGALYPSIFQVNSDKIRDPNRIYPGQALMIT